MVAIDADIFVLEPILSHAIPMGRDQLNPALPRAALLKIEAANGGLMPRSYSLTILF
jgi:hypothetical protein